MTLLSATPVTPEFLGPVWLVALIVVGLLFLSIWTSKR